MDNIKENILKRIVLLNPPGDRIYLRDYYCSKVSKANYINQPTDLLIQSGILKDYELTVIDCIADRIGIDECMQKISEIDPYAIIFISGAVSFNEDIAFLRRVAKKTSALLIGSGDVFMEMGDNILKKYSFIDCCILDFTTKDILNYLDGRDADNMIYRKGGKIIIGPKVSKEFDIPIPRHDLFRSRNYAFPFVRKEPFTTVLISYGCPFKCQFCVMGRLNYKIRSNDAIIEELKYIKKLGIDEIYFNDQTFGVNKKIANSLLRRMIPLKLSWTCYWRVDLTDEKTLVLMKKAGCHTIMYGVESGNQDVLDRNSKGITKQQIISAFKLCRKHGIRTAATFILGLPGDNKESCEETIRFALEIRCDYASFNTPVPRMGTELRRLAIKQGLVNAEKYVMDQSGNYVIMGNENMTAAEIKKARDEAIRRFYFRPSYILKRLFGIRNFVELKNHLKNGFIVLFK
jgi:radical SAM superfamily enzyme YgiQ (UPF0313 family)